MSTIIAEITKTNKGHLHWMSHNGNVVCGAKDRLASVRKLEDVTCQDCLRTEIKRLEKALTCVHDWDYRSITLVPLAEVSSVEFPAICKRCYTFRPAKVTGTDGRVWETVDFTSFTPTKA